MAWSFLLLSTVLCILATCTKGRRSRIWPPPFWSFWCFFFFFFLVFLGCGVEQPISSPRLITECRQVRIWTPPFWSFWCFFFFFFLVFLGCGVEQWSARRAHNPKVASSNLAPATRKSVFLSHANPQSNADFGAAWAVFVECGGAVYWDGGCAAGTRGLGRGAQGG